jgi:hypothetical protein
MEMYVSNKTTSAQSLCTQVRELEKHCSKLAAKTAFGFTNTTVVNMSHHQSRYESGANWALAPGAVQI